MHVVVKRLEPHSNLQTKQVFCYTQILLLSYVTMYVIYIRFEDVVYHGDNADHNRLYCRPHKHTDCVY
jgi:hypothetical protein